MAAHGQLHIHIRRHGGPKNLGCFPKDCRNFIEERRRLRLGDGDAEAIRKMFATLQMKDRNLCHLMDIDEDGRLHNVLWIHPRSKAAYEDFHDVVSFDTTYLVNRTSQSLGGTPVLDPNVAVPRGRPRTTRFMSDSEARGRGRGGRRTSDATRISSIGDRGGRRTSDATRISGIGDRGGRRASGATRGTRGCNSRGGSRVASVPTHGDNNNDNEFLFDLNEDLNASQASFVF
ncbi:hypothetical protein ACS0TY_003859 [Phlomoides rotata]